ncbi:MAG: type III toxin-antitoxin system ToxN/AbiQ family toxin [Lachnospiraceae bacterium]|nr:type III toxin-antitoxin system ToxN/AbiQ family toxin [Lachnospiraceae bacterium]
MTCQSYASNQEPNYKSLLISEYRFIKSIQDKIRKNALSLYNYKTQNNKKIKYIKYCSDFQTLEQACANYKNLKK